jgi:hypothetical protein
MSGVKRRLLDITAVISLLFAAILAAGFTGRMDLKIGHLSSAGTLADYRSLQLGIDRGRFRSYWIQEALAGPGLTRLRVGFTVRKAIRLWPLQAPELRRTFGEFDAHQLLVTPGSVIWIIACPIWCMMVPFLILPGVWLRRQLRQKRRPLRGFAVEEARINVPINHGV